MKHTLTLTRWHKVAERINAALKEREARMVAAFTGATISPWNKEGVEQKAAVMAARGKADLARVEARPRAGAQPRAARRDRRSQPREARARRRVRAARDRRARRVSGELRSRCRARPAGFGRAASGRGARAQANPARAVKSP